MGGTRGTVKGWPGLPQTLGPPPVQSEHRMPPYRELEVQSRSVGAIEPFINAGLQAGGGEAKALGAVGVGRIRGAPVLNAPRLPSLPEATEGHDGHCELEGLVTQHS